MKVSTKGRYALRVMIDLAMYAGEEYLPLKEIARRQRITIKYLEQIVSSLHKAGFVRSQRGNSGGYRLTRDPSQYRVGDILRAMEGSLAPVACLEDETNACERSADCLALPFWEGLDRVIREYVDGVFLSDLLPPSGSTEYQI